MTPDERATYTALRRAGWTASTAHRAARRTTDPALYDRAEAIAENRDYRATTWEANGYQLAATLRSDDHADLEWYGEPTDDTGPDTIPYEQGGAYRSDWKRYRPEYSIADRTADLHKRGMTRSDARAEALTMARLDMLAHRDAEPCYMTVTASRAGVELGRADLSGLDTNYSPSLPYSIARRLMIEYLAETLADLTAEAIAEAEERRPIIAAALAAQSAAVLA